MDIYERAFHVPFSAVDSSSAIRPDAAFEFFQEAAISHAEILGAGRQPMREAGQAWILSRLSVVVERRPLFFENIKVRTWPRGSERLFAVRDFDIQAADGGTIARARSGWLILDVERRRPLRPDALMAKLPLNEGLDALPGSLGSLPAREGLVSAGSRTASYSDVDGNGHVNNARYVSWLEDAVCADKELARFLLECGSFRVDINYQSEVHAGEEAGLFMGRISDGAEGWEAALAMEARRGVDCVFRAELRLGKKPL